MKIRNQFLQKKKWARQWAMLALLAPFTDWSLRLGCSFPLQNLPKKSSPFSRAHLTYS